MENARLLHFLLLSITILLFSCTKRGGDDVSPKDNYPNIKLIENGKYVSTTDPDKYFIVSQLTEDDKAKFYPGTYEPGKYTPYEMYSNITFSDKINFAQFRYLDYTHFEAFIYTTKEGIEEKGGSYIYTKYNSKYDGTVAVRINGDGHYDLGTIKYDSNKNNGSYYPFTPYEFDFVKQ